MVDDPSRRGRLVSCRRLNNSSTAIVTSVDVDSLLSVQEAAAIVGVSRQKIQQLISDGRLPAIRIGRGWQVTMVDVTRLQHTGRHAGRPLGAAQAWTLLHDAERTGRVHTRRGSAERSAEWLVNLVRRKSATVRLHGLDTILDVIAHEVVPSGETAARLYGFAPSDSQQSVDGYIREPAARSLIARYALVPAAGADLNVLLRVVDPAVWPFTRTRRTASELIAAVDMLDTPIDDRAAESARPVIERYL